jgi:hypothetical protein
MVKVGAEAALLDAKTQVAVGRRDDPRARDPALGFAQALEFAVLDHPQELRLHLEGQLADLVQEEAAILGVLEVARLGGACAGKGALGVAEQRRLDQRRCERRAVQREERPRRPAREPMQAVRDELLAAARLALDQHREGRDGELRDLAAQLLHRGARAHQLGDLRRRLPPRAVEDAPEGCRIAGLGDELPGAERARMARVRRIVLSGENQDLHCRRMREQVADQAQTLLGGVRRGRQPEVDQREAGRLRELAHELDRPRPRIDREHLVVAAQSEGQRVGNERVVVDHQERRFPPERTGCRVSRLIGDLIGHEYTS